MQKIINRKSFAVATTFIFSLGIASYYLIPLLLETKYFYYGSEGNHLVRNHFMTLRNFFDPYWYYFTESEIFTRGHIIKAGLPETVIFQEDENENTGRGGERSGKTGGQQSGGTKGGNR